MIPRALTFIVLSIVCALGTRIVMIGAPKNEFITGWRKTLVKLLSKFTCRVSLFALSFVWIKHVNEDSMDYSPWLGKDYKAYLPQKRAPIIIANHQSWSVNNNVTIGYSNSDVKSRISFLHSSLLGERLSTIWFCSQSYWVTLC